MLTSGPVISLTSISWYTLALRPSVDTTVSLTVTFVGSDQLTLTLEPIVSSTPSPLVSHLNPEAGIWSERLGVSEASRVMMAPTSTTSRETSPPMVGSSMGVSERVTVVAIA